MLKSKIEIKNGRPALFIEGKNVPAMAYTTYFNERSEDEDFIKAGYRIFFVNVSMNTAPINSVFTGFTPFRVGVFEDEATPDYSEFETEVHKILSLCPDAIIFPRIHISMPSWWTSSHPDDVTLTNKGGKREALFSEAFRKDGVVLLKRLVEHIKNADYADRIGGWQLCGGQTQEWFHHDYYGSLSEAARKPYCAWHIKNYGTAAKLPERSDYQNDKTGINKNENAVRYALFCNEATAMTVEHFSSAMKAMINDEQVVGVFYGYTYEVQTALLGSYGLRFLLDSPSIDFFSSPNAYYNNRSLGIDWADMIPVDSIKHHGKLCFIECDIRTYLTKTIRDARPGLYPEGIYELYCDEAKTIPSVWAGPPTAELSAEALKKCFAHQRCKASAIWWFDMWGGWYHDPLLMNELAKMKKHVDEYLDAPAVTSASEVILFADETGYANHLCDSDIMWGVINIRSNALGNAGAPYDSFCVEDAEAVLDNYKAAIFPYALPSKNAKRAMALCEEKGIPYLTASPQKITFSTDEIREFYRLSGVHVYNETGDVIYVGNGFLGIHAASEGKKTIRLPQKHKIKAIFGAKLCGTTDTIEIELSKFATAFFEIAPIK